MSYKELEKVLRSRNLLEEEIQMWLRLGIYVTTEDLFYGNENTRFIFDSQCSTERISSEMGRNIRSSVVKWWQTERINPRESEPRVVRDSLDQLADNRQT